MNKNPLMVKLGETLITLRKERGFSVREAAKMCGITASYLSKVERGVFFNSISIHTLTSLAKAYDLPLTHILQSAGFIEKEAALPDLPQYLRLRYRLSPQGIKDMEMAKEIVERKYGGPQK
jgi:transcriptional regulator with XRE-family HTH domain